MPSEKMRPGEVDIDDAMVRALIDQQFPEYRDLELERVDSAGTDNAMYRLGPELAVRLPRLPSAEGQVEKEQRWLPVLARHVTLPIPVPVALGVPGRGFDMHWSIYRWLDGDNAFESPINDLQHAAVALAQFGTELRRLDPTGAPPAWRGKPLALQEADVLAAINDLGGAGVVDRDAALDAWQQIIRIPQWTKAPVWSHSDLLPGNLLVRDGRVYAVIDFGCVGVGDPAADLMMAWTVLGESERDVFREHSDVDDNTWARGRGWAFGFGLMAYHYYHVKNPVLAAIGLRSVNEALPEFVE